MQLLERHLRCQSVKPAPTPVLLTALPMGQLGRIALNHLRLQCSETERNRAGQFMFKADADAFIAAHGLCRLLLSSLDPGVAARAWRFAADRYGKPSIVPGLSSNDLRFSISHTRERVVCIATSGVDCGIDTESCGLVDPGRATSFGLAPEEQRYLDRVAPALRWREFLRFWTLKEAASKALGKGLHLPFDQIRFELEPEPRLHSVPDSDPGDFFLRQISSNDHVESIIIVNTSDDRFDYSVNEVTVI